jgi:methyl-accepting chemotaxis protein
VNRRAGTASVAARLDGDRWLVVTGSVEHVDRRYEVKVLAFCAVLGVYAVVMAMVLPRSLTDPLRDLEAAMRRFVHVGDILTIAHIPVIEDDEIGTLTRCTNELLDELRKLTAAARAIAAGNLALEVDHKGDLPDAFRAMLEQLEIMVVRIRETAVGVASAASEIHATAREQEAAAMAYSDRINEVSAHISSLADAATNITGSATDVLANAEQTLSTTDSMLDKIGQLSTQASGIAESLEVIREIAERSDLLALNGSLEATRAGEVGRGFALVAAEMRRLAERVTKVVIDVRGRIAEIKSSSSNTVMATAQGHKLAEDTANAARRIFTDTQKQSGDTAHVSAAMREMAELMVGVSVATSQTRVATEDLRGQIEELDQVTRQFQLRADSSRSNHGLARGPRLDNLDS